MFSLCLDNYSAGWTEVPFPGRPRVQPVCSSLLGKLYVFGGFTSGGDASVSTDGLCYHPESGQWQGVKAPLTTKGEPLTLTAVPRSPMGMFCLYVQAGLIGIFLRMPSVPVIRWFVNQSISYSL